jgi:hypothetical protein
MQCGQQQAFHGTALREGINGGLRRLRRDQAIFLLCSGDSCVICQNISLFNSHCRKGDEGLRLRSGKQRVLYG